MKFKRMMSAVLAVLCLCCTVSFSHAEETPSPYYDVSKNFWGYEDILYVTDQKLMMGVETGFFAPNLTLSRSMLATVLWRSAGSPPVAKGAPFTDLSQDWYKEAVAWAAENSVVNGVGNGKFAPDAPITREQLVVMLYRYTKACGLKTDTTADLSTFADQSKISSWAVDGMKWACGNGLMKGIPQGTAMILDPGNTSTRAQAAALIHRYSELKKTSETPVTPNEPEKPVEPETPNEQDKTDESEKTEKPAFSEEKALTIVSYNIKCAWYGKTIDQVAEQLKEIDADIVGLQEVDCNTSRSKGVNQVQVIAEKAGYYYYYFEPVIDLTNHNKTEKAPENLDQNAYGHAVLSKYPIMKSEIIWPTTQSAHEEVRNFGRHEIDVNGKMVVFYNCHLNSTLGREQYFEIQENYMSKDKYAICVGDFNETMNELSSYFDNKKFYGFAFGEDMNSPILRSGTNQVIDHIIVSRDTITWKNNEVQNGYYVREHEGASDHNMIYCHINLLD